MTEIFSASRPAIVKRWASSSTVRPVSTNSESQRNGTFIGSNPWTRNPYPYWPSGRLAVSHLGRTGQLAEEAKIVAGKRAHIVDAGTHHRQTLDTQSEGKAAVNVWVVADRAQDIGVDHAGSSHLQPAGPLADAAAGAAADGAIDREVDARLNEREEVAAEPDAPLRPKELSGQF